MDILKSHKFNIDLIPKIESINILGEYDIIICDIHGVGEAFSKEFQGAYLVKEIYKQYPFKIIISYTGITYDARYNEYLKHAEFSLKKDVSSEDFVEKLDAAISLIQDPVHRWNKIKNYLVENDVPTYEIALIEDDFVRRLLSNQDFNDFPKKKIQKNIDSNLRAVLQSFAANILSKILIERELSPFFSSIKVPSLYNAKCLIRKAI